MRLQPIKADSIRTKLFAVSLFAASAGGTIALFSCVPLLARVFSSQDTLLPSHSMRTVQTVQTVRSQTFSRPDQPLTHLAQPTRRHFE